MQRMLLTPDGALLYDPANLAGALNKLGQAKAHEPEYAPSFPRIQAMHGEWRRQNIDGGRWWPIPAPELHELLGIDEVA